MDVLYDVCIVGAGVEGSATARYLASRGKKTLLLEQFPVPHTRGSSHGQSRICRYGYPQTYYAALMPEAFQMWKELEKDSNTKLFKAVGCLTLQEPPHSDIARTANCVRHFGNECQLLDGCEIKRRFPMLNFPSDVEASYEPASGMLFADKCLKTLQEQFVNMGGVLCDGEKVLDILPGQVITVTTSKGNYKTKKLVLTAGPWTNKLLKPLGITLPLTPWRIHVCYWEVENEMYHTSNGFPCFIFIPNDGRDVYGLPEHEYPGFIKIAAHEGVPTDADSRDDVRGDETFVRSPANFIRRFTTGIKCDPGIVEYCMYTVTPDHDFVLDRHPSFTNIVIGAGFSGHGFKMAPVIGKILSQLALGEKVSYDISPFRVSRFDNIAVKSTL